MRLKKINAALGLLSIVFMLLHIAYTVFSYLTFYYNPLLKMIFAVPFMVLVCLHAICGMLTVFTQSDGTRMDLYPKLNMKTILQRVSAALIFPLLILHINTFSLLKAAAERKLTFLIILLFISEMLFFATVLTHVSISLTKGLVTLGILTSVETQKKLDRIIYIVCGIIYIVAVCSVLKTQIAMFLN
ncbi:MAG: hypothetical protein K5931_07240 [Lachnospiraceae bacterium]|nr:hypothetical protein [Lachnospiraceae bacterium]